MNKMKQVGCGFLIFLLLAPSLFSQQPREGFFQNMTIAPALRGEYFGLTLAWEKKAHSSKFKSYLFTLDTELQMFEGFSFHLLFGYSLSNFDGLVFRKLPFSVELDVGYLGGLVLGAEIDKKLIHFPDYELNIFGQIIYSFRFWKNTWEVAHLHVDGTVTGSPCWFRAQIGPVIRYLGFDYLSPYISIMYGKLWGKFRMEQEIQDLTGLEKQKVVSLSDFTFLIGTLYELTDQLLVTGEVTLFPYKDGINVGATLGIKYLF